MSFESLLRKDILPEDLKKKQSKFKVISEVQFAAIVDKAAVWESRTTTPGPAKNINDVAELIKYAIEDRQAREETTQDANINFVYAHPDKEAEIEAISFSIVARSPGMHAQGSPFDQGNKTRQLKPICRQVVSDPDNPGYKRAVLGQFYDNKIHLTAWARTNKSANDRALWLESVMEEYSWFFSYSGVNRMLYLGRPKGKDAEITLNIQGNKIYGRPVEYFVRTERLQNVSQKELEQVCVRVAIAANQT